MRKDGIYEKIEKGIVWVMGQKVKIDNTEEYEALLEQARHDAIRLHGHQEQNWDKQKYFKRLERQCKKQQEQFKTVKAAQEYINSKPWDLIFTISYAAHKALNAQEEENKTNENKK